MKPSQKLTLGRILVSKNKAIGDTRYTDRLGSTFTTVFFVIKRRITAICSAKGREKEILSSVHEHCLQLKTDEFYTYVECYGDVTRYCDTEWVATSLVTLGSFDYLPNLISSCVSLTLGQDLKASTGLRHFPAQNSS